MLTNYDWEKLTKPELTEENLADYVDTIIENFSMYIAVGSMTPVEKIELKAKIKTLKHIREFFVCEVTSNG